MYKTYGWGGELARVVGGGGGRRGGEGEGGVIHCNSSSTRPAHRLQLNSLAWHKLYSPAKPTTHVWPSFILEYCTVGTSPPLAVMIEYRV